MTINPSSSTSAPALSLEEQQTLDASEQNNSNKNILSGLKLSWYYGIIPLIGILALLALVEVKRKIDHARLKSTLRDHKALMLRNYVGKYLKMGHSKEEIRNALVKYHYAPHDIEEAFRGIR